MSMPFQKGNKFGKANRGRKRPDLAERNRKGLSAKTRKKIGNSRRGLRLVSRPDNPCPYCGSIYVRSMGSSWRCNDCGKSWVKNPKQKSIPNHGVSCPDCNGNNIVSRGKSWQCKDCNKFWRKNPKPKGWRIKNLPAPKIYVSKKELKKLYWRDNLCQREIAKKLGVSQSRIHQLMEEYSIPNRGKSEGVNRRSKKLQAKINKKISKALRGNINWRFSHRYPNSEEKKLIRFFKKWNLPFKYVGDGSFKIDGKCPDFIHKNKKLIIEFFGELWHKESDEPNRIGFFKKRGWGCLIIWGKECRGKCRLEKTYSWERRLYDRIVRWLAGLDS